METGHLHGVSEQDSDAPPEDLLVQHDRYIVALVTQLARSSSNLGHSDVLDLELDELVQLVRIKFYHALLSRHIDHPKAYIRMIALNELRDLTRKRRPPVPLQADEDGEFYIRGMVQTESEWTTNPEDACIEGESFHELLDFVLSFFEEIPPRQRRVLACRLYDAFGGCLDVLEAFRHFSINNDAYLWPEDEVDKKLLQASQSAARKNLLKKINLRIEQCEHMSVPEKIRERAENIR